MADHIDENAMALSILCQAYLFAHSDSHGVPDIKAADPIFFATEKCFREMRVTADVLASLKSILRSKRNDVIRPCWWAGVFAVDSMPSRDQWKRVGPYCTRLADAVFAGQHDKVHLGRSPEIRLHQVVPALLELFARFGNIPPSEVLIVQPDLIAQPIVDWPTIIDQIGKHSAELYSLPWQAFEDLIARLLQESGWYVQQMGRTRDGGKDIIAVQRVVGGRSMNMIVQCKRNARSRKVDVCPVRELWAIKEMGDYDRAMIATTSFFSKDAAAENVAFWRLELKDHNAITEWCKALSRSNHR